MPDPELPESLDAVWLGLVIGNTRLHWAQFKAQQLLRVWHTPHLTAALADRLMQHNFSGSAWREVVPSWPALVERPGLAGTDPSPDRSWLPLYCASVVPQQSALWQAYASFHEIHLDYLPLSKVYPTLGLDRALNLLGAGDRYGWPSLVIDAGTALTFTAGDADGLVGGAILPGIATQFSALAHTTVTLPTIQAHSSLPPRWSANTADAMRSGVIYGMLATIQDFLQAWYTDYPQGYAVLTGGDSPQLYEWLRPLDMDGPLHQDADIAFWGLASYRRHRLGSS
jgi:type III pantothenate kinase